MGVSLRLCVGMKVVFLACAFAALLACAAAEQYEWQLLATLNVLERDDDNNTIPDTAIMGRYGHATAYVENTDVMLVYGGYLQGGATDPSIWKIQLEGGYSTNRVNPGGLTTPPPRAHGMMGNLFQTNGNQGNGNGYIYLYG